MKKLRTLNMKSNRNGYVISVAVALLVASVLLGVYYVALRPAQTGYMTLYVLDSQKKAIDYPERLVKGENSTFSVYVEVENHNGTVVDCQIQVKIAKDLNPTYPVNVNATETSSRTLNDGDIWENVTKISLNQPGNYMVVFELWTVNRDVPQFSGEFIQLNVSVVDKPTA